MLQVDLGFFFREGSAAAGAGSTGAMNLMGARIGDQVSLASASLTNATGPCLVADSLQVNQHMSLTKDLLHTVPVILAQSVSSVRASGVSWTAAARAASRDRPRASR